MSDIQAKGLSKHYRTLGEVESQAIEAVRDISLTVDEAEFVTVFGPNACGKTTLLKMIAGLEEADMGGSVSICGKKPQDVRIGYIFQNYADSLLPWKTALDNVAFPLRLSGLSRNESQKKTRDFLEKLGMDIPEDSFPYELSGGQQQTTAILRTFNYQPDVFVLDEPFSSLDFQARLEMQDLFLKIWDKNRRATVFVSHEIDEALYLCDRMIMLTKGPARIAKVLKNDFPRPRKREMLNDPNFLDLRKEAIETFMQEVPG